MKRIYDKEYKELFQTENGIYYFRYWSPSLGRELEASLKTTDRREALKERKRRLESVRDEKTKDALEYKTFSQVIDAFWNDTVWDAPKTEYTAKNQLFNHIKPWFGNYDPEKITNNLWRRYALQRRTRDPECSLFNARKYLWKVVNWAFDKRIIRGKFVPDDFDEGRESPGIVLSDLEFHKVFRLLNQSWQDIASFGWGMGMRVGEIKAMRWEWIDEKTHELNLPAWVTKTRRPRSPVVPDHLYKVLERRLRDQEMSKLASEFVFPSPVDPKKHFSKGDQAWQRAKRNAGVECRFHDLRHTWLTRAFKTSNRYAEICEYAGLTLEEAIETYVEFTDEDMRKIAEMSAMFTVSPGNTWENAITQTQNG